MMTIINFRRGIGNDEVFPEFVSFMKVHVHKELTGSTISARVLRFSAHLTLTRDAARRVNMLEILVNSLWVILFIINVAYALLGFIWSFVVDVEVCSSFQRQLVFIL